MFRGTLKQKSSPFMSLINIDIIPAVKATSLLEINLTNTTKIYCSYSSLFIHLIYSFISYIIYLGSILIYLLLISFDPSEYCKNKPQENFTAMLIRETIMLWIFEWSLLSIFSPFMFKKVININNLPIISLFSRKNIFKNQLTKQILSLG